MRLKKHIGAGAYSDVYAWDKGRVLKLFKDSVKDGDVDCEARVVKAVRSAGLAAPMVGEKINVNGRTGLIYERINGPTMFEYCKKKQSELPRCARIMTKMHAEIHMCNKVTGLKSQREWLKKLIGAGSTNGLPEDLQIEMLETLSGMPEGDRLCHNDFWPGNIVMSKQGPVVIDWGGTAIGNPLSDVARTLVLKEVGLLPQQPQRNKQLMIGFYGSYLKRYFRLCPGDEQEVVVWASIIAAACLGDNWTWLPKDWLLRQIRGPASFVR
jgi:uncharacterized protein (TIGR02172 family)